MHILISILFFCFIVESDLLIDSDIEGTTEEEVIFYNSYGYLDGEEWVIPLRIYVLENRSVATNLSLRLANLFKDLNADERQLFRSRISEFIADSESRETVEFILTMIPIKKYSL